MSNNPALEWLVCHDNWISELDVSNNPVLSELDCSNNELTELDTSNLPALHKLYCQNNRLTRLDTSSNPELSVLHCYSNRLTELYVSEESELEWLHCSKNQLTSLEVPDRAGSYSFLLTCENNTYAAAFDEDRTFDLSTLPGNFDISRVDNWIGGSIEGTILTLNENADWVTYRYYCGRNKYATFTIFPEGTVFLRPGDANDDGEVDMKDAVLTARGALNLIDEGVINMAAADADGDGRLTMGDAVLVARIALNLNDD